MKFSKKIKELFKDYKDCDGPLTKEDIDVLLQEISGPADCFKKEKQDKWELLKGWLREEKQMSWQTMSDTVDNLYANYNEGIVDIIKKILDKMEELEKK